jgi:hypothetical protein
MLFQKPDFQDLAQMMEGIELMTCTKCGSRDWEMRVNYEIRFYLVFRLPRRGRNSRRKRQTVLRGRP